MKNQCKRILIVSAEINYTRVLVLLIKSLDDKTMEIINSDMGPIKSVEMALSLIKENKPDIILLDHFLSGTPFDRILDIIKPEDGEGIRIANGIDFFYAGEIKPKVISISSRSKKEMGSLYGDRIKHYSEGDALKLEQCLNEKCSC